MSETINYRPRLVFDVTEEQLRRSQQLFTNTRLRSDALSRLLDWLLDGVEREGEGFAARVVYDREPK